MSFPAAEYHRRHARYPVEMNCSLQVMLPEETFGPEIYVCHSCDVSAHGMLVYLDKISAEIYFKLLPTTRHARICFADPFSGKGIALTGHIAWIDYQQLGSTEQSGSCFMGAHFDDRDNPDLNRYAKFARRVSGQFIPSDAELVK